MSDFKRNIPNNYKDLFKFGISTTTIPMSELVTAMGERLESTFKVVPL